MHSVKAPEAQTVTITNTGLALITLNQPTATDFDIGELSATTLPASGATATFTVRPKADLEVGVYYETIAINASNEVSAIVDVSFEVTTDTGESTAGSGGCNVIGYALAMWLALLLFIPKRRGKGGSSQ